LLAQLSSELDQHRKDAATAIERERAAMQRAVVDGANELSVRIARRLLERLPASAGFSAFLEGLSGELSKLPAESRSSLAASDPDHPLEVVAAVTLNEKQTARLREAIRAALGSELPIRLSCDPNLIAGFEIRSHSVIVRNNWQADLAAIRKELDR
jgi:F-type H+-transporting ATPase subunit b